MKFLDYRTYEFETRKRRDAGGRRVFLRPVVLPKRTSRDPLGKARSGPSCRSARPGSRVRARWPVSLSRASWTGGSRRCSGRGPRGRRFRMVRRDVIVSRRKTPWLSRLALRARASRPRPLAGTLATRAARGSRAGRSRASHAATRRSRPPRRRRARRPPAPLSPPRSDAVLDRSLTSAFRASRGPPSFFNPNVQRDANDDDFLDSRHHLRGGV